MFKPACLPILIGSLPIDDHEEATRIILSHTPEIPLWPQLPKYPKEGMIRQFLSGFPGLVEKGPKYWIDTGSNDFAEEMAIFYEDYFQVVTQQNLPDKSRFSLSHETASGFFSFQAALDETGSHPVTVKGQVTGPMTTGIGVKDQDGRSIFYDDNLRDVLIKLLSLKARWQVEQMRKYTDKIPPIIFIDEPGIVSFGSTAYAGISREMVSNTVSEVIEGIKVGGGLAGIHICANGDWAPALSSNADIISFDAYSYFDNFILYREQLTNFLSRGGILAWGIVPTGDPLIIAEESVEHLYMKWQEQLQILSSFGFTKRQLMEQTLIAPSCGTGSLDIKLALKVLSLTSLLAKKIQRLIPENGK